MSELKPCPFCGGEACIQRHEFIGYTDTFGVVCLNCHAETRQFFTHEKVAVRAWNRRVESERPKGYMKIEANIIDGEDVICETCGAYSLSPLYKFCPKCGIEFIGVRGEQE